MDLGTLSIAGSSKWAMKQHQGGAKGCPSGQQYHVLVTRGASRMSSLLNLELLTIREKAVYSLLFIVFIVCHIYIYISAQRVQHSQPPISGSNSTIWVSPISKKLSLDQFLLLFSRTCTRFNRQGTNGQQLPMRTQTHMNGERLLRWQKLKYTTNKFAKHGDEILNYQSLKDSMTKVLTMVPYRWQSISGNPKDPINMVHAF